MDFKSFCVVAVVLKKEELMKRVARQSIVAQVSKLPVSFFLTHLAYIGISSTTSSLRSGCKVNPRSDSAHTHSLKNQSLLWNINQAAVQHVVTHFPGCCCASAQYILELAKTLQRDPRSCVDAFFTRSALPRAACPFAAAADASAVCSTRFAVLFQFSCWVIFKDVVLFGLDALFLL